MSKKIFSFILIFAVLAVSLVSFSSCRSPYSEEEAREILEEVLAKDVELNKIIWGEGLPTREDPGEHVNDSTFYYMEVSPDSAYIGLDELKEAVRDTYAKKLREIVWEHAFGDGDVNKESETIPRYDENDGYLQIDVTKEGFDLKNVAYIGESEIVRAKKNMIEIEIKVSADGENFREKTLVLQREDGVWKLDTQSWCVDFVF